jgi:hypothetical protein
MATGRSQGSASAPAAPQAPAEVTAAAQSSAETTAAAQPSPEAAVATADRRLPDAAARTSAAAPARRSPDRLTRVLSWAAAIGIIAAVFTIIVVSAAGPSLAVVNLPKPAVGPPFWLWLHPSLTLLTFVLWGAAGVGGAGVIAGLAAVARGARPSVRAIITFAFLAIAALTVLPPAGSTDILDYAANGRMIVTGHSPYVMTPLQLKNTGDPIGQWIPWTWDKNVSVYGPVASAEEWAAAELGGNSMARVTFWLKLWNSIAFGAVVLMLDRMLRSSPARRLRAHLLWTVNPLLLWEIVASGHIDVLSAAFGLLGILMVRGATRAGKQPALEKYLLAGLFIGVAAAIKIPYAVFGLGVAWAARRSLAALAASALGFLLIFGPAYAVAGRPAVKVLLSRGQGTTWDTMYQVFFRPLGYKNFGYNIMPPHFMLVAGLCFIAVAIVVYLRFPDATPGLPALSPALALSLAWLFAWPYQRPWYDVMAICLLAIYPASRLDWIVIVRLILTAPVYMPGMPATPHGWLDNIVVFQGDDVSAYGRFLATVALVLLCIFGFWGWRRRGADMPGGNPPVLQSLI